MIDWITLIRDIQCSKGNFLVERLSFFFLNQWELIAFKKSDFSPRNTKKNYFIIYFMDSVII